MPAMDNAHALLVGIADYRHVNKLPPVKDVPDVADLLTDPARCAYPRANVQTLLDGQATLAALRQGLADLARRSDPNSTVFLYFSGHGGRIEAGAHAGQYLLPVDAAYPDDQALARTALSGTEFTAALNAIPGRKVVVVFDCCHSGGIGQPRDPATPAFQAGLAESYYDALRAGRGRVILASSRSTEYSYVLGGSEYGLFTQHLLAGLRGGVASEDGFIRIFDLFEYLQPRVTAGHSQQHPLFKAELEENFPVALYLGGQKGVVPRDEQGFRHDAYVSYVDREPDATWVWDTLVPRLEKAGLRIAVSGDSADPGVARVVGMERGIRQAKRILVVLSPAYLTDHAADFENVLGQTVGLQEGAYRLLPVKIAALDEERLPTRLRMLTTLDLAHPRRAGREFDRLVRALQGPLPERSRV
jgi:hypothetical protein